MYVCLCNGHTSQQLETLARSGVACVEHAYEILGGSPACRQCVDYAEAILAEAGPGAPDQVPGRGCARNAGSRGARAMMLWKSLKPVTIVDACVGLSRRRAEKLEAAGAGLNLSSADRPTGPETGKAAPEAIQPAE